MPVCGGIYTLYTRRAMVLLYFAHKVVSPRWSKERLRTKAKAKLLISLLLVVGCVCQIMKISRAMNPPKPMWGYLLQETIGFAPSTPKGLILTVLIKVSLADTLLFVLAASRRPAPEHAD